jgi:outer membrane protein assembly factor BamB
MSAFLVAVNSNLTPKWAASLQTRLTDGCGVLVAIAPVSNPNQPNSCRTGATAGVDPTTNAPGSGVIIDEGSSSPTVLPDGTVVFGATSNYNAARGHLFHFDANGNYLGAYDFGWDTTPAAYIHGGTFSIVLKDNHYDAPMYCFYNNPICQTLPPGPYYITQLDANLGVEWQFQNATLDANHPGGYEWCINMPAVDRNGNVYVNSEDGNIYELAQAHPGTPAGKLFLNLAIGAAYTPLSIGPDGKLYTQNDGRLFVVGN